MKEKKVEHMQGVLDKLNANYENNKQIVEANNSYYTQMLNELEKNRKQLNKLEQKEELNDVEKQNMAVY